MRMMSALVDLVSRVPARVQVKLLAAFLAIEILLIVMGAVGLEVLSGVNQRTDELIRLQRKIEAYRQVQNDTTSQLYGVSSALLARLGFPRHDEVGGRFDPSRHEAVSTVADPDTAPGTVVEVVRPGYGDGERQLRPAAAVVSTKPQ